MMSNSFTRALALVALLAFGGAYAAEVDGVQAGDAARRWLGRCPLPMGTRLVSREGTVRTFRRPDGTPRCHVVDLDGGGYVVTAADTRQAPIVCFSTRGRFDMSDDNPLKAILAADMDAQRAEAIAPRAGPAAYRASAERAAEEEWDGLLRANGGVAYMNMAIKSASKLSDVRVPALVKSQWSQRSWGGQTVFNYYTPEHYPCGCVATAFGQVMRYWQQPKQAVAAASLTCYVDGKARTLTMKGGTYDWKNMPLQEPWSVTKAERQAIGKLVYDIGVASQMSYDKYGSGTFGVVAATALASRFGYASARSAYDDTEGTALAGAARNAIFASLDAGMPVVVGLGSWYGDGHEVVLDGYGYSGGNAYVHMNCGWGDSTDDIWYRMMREAVTSEEYTFLKEISYNIHPTKGGEVLSGRVTDGSTGKAVSGAVVTLTDGAGVTQTAKTNARGIYAFRITARGTCSLSASVGKKRSWPRKVAFPSLGSDAVVEIVSASMGYWRADGSVANKWGQDLAVATPPNAKATDGTRTDGVRVTWNAVTGATQYNVLRDGETIASVTGTAFLDTEAEPAVSHSYRVVASSANGEIAGTADTGWRKPLFELAVTSCTFDSAGGTLAVPLRGNVPWTFEDQVPWADDLDGGGLDYLVPENAEGYRTGAIRYTATFRLKPTGKEITSNLTYRVTQLGERVDTVATYAAGSFKGAAARTYDGYLFNEATLRQVGTVAVSVKKANSKGVHPVTATVALGGKKYSFAGGTTKDGTVKGLKCKKKGAKKLTLKLGADGIGGKYGGYVIYGSRRGLGAGTFAGAWTIDVEMLSGGARGRVAVAVTSGGKATVTYIAANGKSATATAWIVSDPEQGFAYVPVRISVPGAGVQTWLLRIDGDGRAALVSGVAANTTAGGRMPWQGYGTYVGEIELAAGTLGAAQVSVAASGKMSGKFVVAGRTWTFSAAGWGVDSVMDPVSGTTNFTVTAVASSTYKKKTQKKRLTLDCRVPAEGMGVRLEGKMDVVSGGETNVYATLSMVRVSWDRPEMQDVLAAYVGTRVCELPDGSRLTVKVDASGGVKATGKLKSGRAVSLSTKLLYGEPVGAYFILDLPSATVKKKKYPALHETVEVNE